MKALSRTSLALLVVLLACDSGTPEADARADIKADIKADAKADIKADAIVDLAADIKADAKAELPVPTLKSVAEVEAALGAAIELRAADLDLSGVLDLLARGELRSAAELELFLNAPGGAAHRIDIDADGKLDYLQVVELRVDGDIRFELRAIPSSKLDLDLAVLVATVATVRLEAEGAIKLIASYSPAVAGGAEFKAEHSFEATFKPDAVLLVDASAGAFVAWAIDLERTAHVSAHLSPVDIELVGDGAAQFVGDASASIDAARLVALRAKLDLDLDLDARVAAPKVSAKASAKAKSAGSVEHSATAKSSVKVGTGGGAKAGGGISIGGSVKGKAGAGFQFGK